MGEDGGWGLLDGLVLLAAGVLVGLAVAVLGSMRRNPSTVEQPNPEE